MAGQKWNDKKSPELNGQTSNFATNKDASGKLSQGLVDKGRRNTLRVGRSRRDPSSVANSRVGAKRNRAQFEYVSLVPLLPLVQFSVLCLNLSTRQAASLAAPH